MTFQPRPFVLVDCISVARVQPRTSKGHHRPVIASNFPWLNTKCPSKKFKI